MSSLNHIRAERVIQLLRASSQPVSIPFITPILSVMLGAMTILDRAFNRNRLRLNPDIEDYARTNGLMDIIDRVTTVNPSVGGNLWGKTYSKVTQLARHDEVDGCNATVNSLFRQQLGGYSKSVVSQLCRVVGELHDNVASHARGGGFSCAQVYSQGGRAEVQFAVADAGCGMTYNVNGAMGGNLSDREAISWCLMDGHTTAICHDEWTQRLPEDTIATPCSGVFSTRTDDHHLGLGLGHLVKLVNSTKGELWILSGNGEYLLEPSGEHFRDTRMNWQGVAIEFSIPVVSAGDIEPTDAKTLDNLGRRLGI
jgi:hypothetical protein